ncbi:MAG TPA: hypothetical protein VE338_07090 [Ktedonobacterales bacterium]|nr:hypothetical protein [Ktedonobacterales bacterium]
MSQLAMRPEGQAQQTTDLRDDAALRRARFGQRMWAAVAGAVAGLLLIILILLGSRGFQWFDAALIGYAVGTIFAAAAVT